MSADSSQKQTPTVCDKGTQTIIWIAKKPSKQTNSWESCTKSLAIKGTVGDGQRRGNAPLNPSTSHRSCPILAFAGPKTKSTTAGLGPPAIDLDVTGPKTNQDTRPAVTRSAQGAERREGVGCRTKIVARAPHGTNQTKPTPCDTWMQFWVCCVLSLPPHPLLLPQNSPTRRCSWPLGAESKFSKRCGSSSSRTTARNMSCGMTL